MAIEIIVDFATASKEIADEARKLVRGLQDPAHRTGALKAIASALFTGALVGACIGGLLAIGQIVAIDSHTAWNLYGLWWLLSPVFGVLLLVSGVLLGLAIYLLEYLFRGLTQTLKPETVRQVRGIAIRLLPAVLLSFLVGSIVWVGYEFTRERHKMLSSGEAQDTEALTKLVSGQAESLAALSGPARDLLEQLEKTEVEIRTVKGELTTTLAALEQQREGAEKTARELKNLEERRAEINLRVQELERILQGKVPVTRDDVREASNSSLLVGVIVGFLTSLGASFVFRYLIRMRQDRTSLD